MLKSEKSLKSDISKSNSNIIKISFVLILTLFIISICVSSVQATNWNVSSGDSIQSVIDNNASENDTITVNNGTYNENIVVNKKNLTLKANGNVTINASDSGNPVFHINSEGSESTIQGFTITGATNSYGLRLDSTINCTIKDLIIENCSNGIYITGTNDHIILKNLTINNSTNCGIDFYGSISDINTNILITGIVINSTGFNGILFEDKVDNITLDTLSIINTHYDSILGGAKLSNLNMNNVTVTNSGVFGINFSDLNNGSLNNVTVTDSAGDGIHLTESTGSLIIKNCVLTGNGFLLMVVFGLVWF